MGCLVSLFKVYFLLLKFVGVEFGVGLSAYPPTEACSGIVEIAVYISVINQPLDGFNPIMPYMWPSFDFFRFLAVL